MTRKQKKSPPLDLTRAVFAVWGDCPPILMALFDKATDVEAFCAGYNLCQDHNDHVKNHIDAERFYAAVARPGSELTGDDLGSCIKEVKAAE